MTASQIRLADAKAEIQARIDEIESELRWCSFGGGTGIEGEARGLRAALRALDGEQITRTRAA